MALDDEAGEGGGGGTAIALLDIVKAYEYIQLNYLWILGLILGCPSSTWRYSWRPTLLAGC